MANENKTEKKDNHGGLKRKLRIMTIAPIIVMGILVAILSYCVFSETIQKEVRRNLSNLSDSVILYFDAVYQGDYSVQKISDDEYILYKGETDISKASDALERFKQDTGADITLFYYDIRMLSTLTQQDGSSVLFTIANKNVADAVINGRTEQFYNNINIDGVVYFAVYVPMYNSDGKCIGMVATCKPTTEIDKESRRSLFWIPIVTVFMTLFAAWVSMFPANSLVSAINKEKKFLDEISKGNLNAEIDKEIVERKDELGDMGRFSRGVQKFLREMIERDTLTRLYTRRVGSSKIAYVQSQLNQAGVKYCVCMGDIDFFKKFNDTYGHDCGDLVLRDVASIFNEFMLGKGFFEPFSVANIHLIEWNAIYSNNISYPFESYWIAIAKIINHHC